MFKYLLIAIFLVMLRVFPAHAQDQVSQPADTVTLWQEVKALVPTRVLLPSNFDAQTPHTLILALHGYGSTAESFARFASTFTQNGYIFAVPEAAYAMLDEKGRLVYDWWLYQMSDDQELQRRALMLLIEDQLPAVVKELQKRYKINHIYVLGFSQGAITAYLVGIYQHKLFDGIIAFSNITKAEWYPDSTLSEGRNVRVLILHGKEDERVPFSEDERTRDLLYELGYDVTFRAFEGGHAVPQDELSFVINWIQAGTDGNR